MKKVVIPVGGLGTRFLPFTKVIPKEMLPIGEIPSILLLVEEAYDAGFTDVVFIQGRGKTAIEDFFDVSYEVEKILYERNKLHLIDRVRNVRERMNIVSIRQQRALGLGHAILTARSVVGDEDFAVILGDELMYKSQELSKLREISGRTGGSAVSLMRVAREDVQKYGIAKVSSCDVGDFLRIEDLVEKPRPGQEPSLFALPGRYFFKSSIFSYLEKTKPGVGGEIQLTDAMVSLAREEGLFGRLISCERYDLGDKFGFLQANIAYALRDVETRDKLLQYLGCIK